MKKILIVEDDANATAGIRLALELHDQTFDIRAVENVSNAEKINAAWKPDVCIVDYTLDDEAGASFVATVRNEPPENHPVLIGLSGDRTGHAQNDMVAAGADYVFCKPFDLSTFGETVASVYEKIKMSKKSEIGVGKLLEALTRSRVRVNKNVDLVRGVIHLLAGGKLLSEQEMGFLGHADIALADLVRENERIRAEAGVAVSMGLLVAVIIGGVLFAENGRVRFENEKTKKEMQSIMKEVSSSCFGRDMRLDIGIIESDSIDQM